MKAEFVELPPFARHRHRYLDDGEFRALQNKLMEDPCAGDLIVGSGGLRKLRFREERRSKGNRGGLRVIYYWWVGGNQFWLFTLYSKDEIADLTADERKALEGLLLGEVKVRGSSK